MAHGQSIVPAPGTPRPAPSHHEGEQGEAADQHRTRAKRYNIEQISWSQQIDLYSLLFRDRPDNDQIFAVVENQDSRPSRGRPDKSLATQCPVAAVGDCGWWLRRVAKVGLLTEHWLARVGVSNRAR